MRRVEIPLALSFWMIFSCHRLGCHHLLFAPGHYFHGAAETLPRDGRPLQVHRLALHEGRVPRRTDTDLLRRGPTPGKRHRQILQVSTPGNHEVLGQCCFNAGPASALLVHHQTNIDAGPALSQHWLNVSRFPASLS